MLDRNGAVTGGSILFEGNDLAQYKTEKQWRTIRGKKISMVMQDPMTSLNPLKRIGTQIQRPSVCWMWSASLTRSSGTTSIRMSFQAVCVSVSLLRLP